MYMYVGINGKGECTLCEKVHYVYMVLNHSGFEFYDYFLN